MALAPSVHPVQCDGCQMYPINGSRYKCRSCNEFDFCENCFKIQRHNTRHIFDYINSPVEEFRRDVVPHLKEGLLHIKESAELLLKLDSVKTSVLQESVQKGVRSLRKSEYIANSYLKKVDSCTESLTLRKGRLESKSTDLQTLSYKLENEYQSIKDNLRNSEQALSRTKTEMRKSQRELERWRETERRNQAERDRAIGLMFIPLVGLIVGPIMYTSAQNDIERAERNARDARDQVNSFNSWVNHYESRKRHINEQKRSQQQQISSCKNDIQKSHNDLENVKRARKNLADIQVKLRDALHFLSRLTGRADVAQMNCQKSLHQFSKPLLNVMKSILDLLTTAGNENKHFLLKEPAIQRAIESLQEALRASTIADKHSDILDEYY